jgi:predicted RNA-binding protein with PUA-like domain
MPKLWVYKCNSGSSAQGDWERFFEDGGAGEWGGTEYIRNASSTHIVREELSPGDLVLAWQSDRQSALGLCRVTKLKHEQNEVWIILDTVCRFDNPVKLLSFKKQSRALRNGLAFVQGRQETIYPTTPEEANEILRLCGCDARPSRGRGRKAKRQRPGR